jgi:hypothetical protein
MEMNRDQIKRLKEIVIYKGLGYFKDEENMVKGLEKLGYVELETGRQFARPTRAGIDYIFDNGHIKGGN